MRRMRLSAAAVALFAGVLVTPHPGSAGTIGFRTDVEVKAGPGIDAKVKITHTGDEAATGVSVHAELLGRITDGVEIPRVIPGGSEEWQLHLADEVPKGNYAIVLRTRYTDDNGYPFEVLSNATASVGAAPAPRVFGSIEAPRLPVGGEITARVLAKKPPARAGDYELRLVVPDGLEVTPSSATLAFDDTGKGVALFRIRNRRLLAGTSLNVFAIVHGSDHGLPQDDMIRGTVTIGAAEVRVAAATFYRVAAGLAALLVVLEIGAWLAARRTRTA